MDTTEKEPYLTHTMLKVHFLSQKIGFDKPISCKIRPTLICRKRVFRFFEILTFEVKNAPKNVTFYLNEILGQNMDFQNSVL